MLEAMDEVGVSKLSADLAEQLGPSGFELHPFLVGWYNERVGEKFFLDFPAETLAFVVISQPSMFENAFLPYLASCTKLEALHDPIDECMLHYFSKLTSCYPDTVALHDFQLSPSRRPKVLVQTAGHVSGAVRFYQPEEAKGLEKEGKKYFPVCHHPTWGGWFALRGVIIFTKVKAANLYRQLPVDLLTEEQVSELVKQYNGNWQDALWRDVGRSGEESSSAKYSDLAIKYFDTKPSERMGLIKNLLGKE